MKRRHTGREQPAKMGMPGFLNVQQACAIVLTN